MVFWVCLPVCSLLQYKLPQERIAEIVTEVGRAVAGAACPCSDVHAAVMHSSRLPLPSSLFYPYVLALAKWDFHSRLHLSQRTPGHQHNGLLTLH